MMSLRALVEKAPDSDFLREKISFAAERLMELDIGALTVAAHGERNPATRLAQRNGDRDRVKVRDNGRIISAAMIVAVGAHADGRREVLGMDIGPSEAETFWTEFLRNLRRRGPRGVKLVISDAHEGIEAAASKVLTVSWQRCRVHFMRNVLTHATRSGRRVVSAFIATAFAQDDVEAARSQWRKVADQPRPTTPRLAALMDEAEVDALACMAFPAAHRTKLHSTNPIERLNGEIKRRTEVVGIVPNEDAIIPLIRAILLEQNDVYESPPICKDFRAATETGLAVVYPALSRGDMAAGPDGIRGSAAGQMAELVTARIISMASAEPGLTGSPSLRVTLARQRQLSF